MAFRLSACAIAALCACSAANASFTQISLSPIANHNLATGGSINGNLYPVGDMTLGGVPFNIPTTQGANIWHSAIPSAILQPMRPTTGEAFEGEGAFSQQDIVAELEVSIAGVDKVHSLMNTWWGSAGFESVTVEFFGAARSYASFTLVGNDDIRDYNNAVHTNQINGVTTEEVFGTGRGQRLDKQVFDLPEGFLTDTLTLIRITDRGADGFSRSFLAGLTAQTDVPTIPLPSAAGLGFAGVLAVAAVRRRRA